MRMIAIVVLISALAGATGYLWPRDGALDSSAPAAAIADETRGEALSSDSPGDASSGGAGAAAAPVPASAPATREVESKSAKSIVYQWVDEKGTVHFAASLDAVPADWRSRAGQIEIGSAKPVQVASSTQLPIRPRRAVARAEPERRADVTVYTAPWCGWCRKTLAFLDAKGVDYVNKDIEVDAQYADELREKTGGTAIPFVEIDGNPIHGFDPAQMTRLLASSR